MTDYLFVELVPEVPIVSLVVPEFFLILCCNRGDRNHPSREVKEIVDNSVGECTWKERRRNNLITPLSCYALENMA